MAFWTYVVDLLTISHTLGINIVGLMGGQGIVSRACCRVVIGRVKVSLLQTLRIVVESVG